jgi:hypothetical protein
MKKDEWYPYNPSLNQVLYYKNNKIIEYKIKQHYPRYAWQCEVRYCILQSIGIKEYLKIWEN